MRETDKLKDEKKETAVKWGAGVGYGPAKPSNTLTAWKPEASYTEPTDESNNGTEGLYRSRGDGFSGKSVGSQQRV